MTFDEPEKYETAIADALRSAGMDVEFNRMVTLALQYIGNPEGAYRRLATERAIFRKIWRGVELCALAAKERESVRPPTKVRVAIPKRKPAKELAPAAMARARRITEEIGSKAVREFMAQYGHITLGSIDAHLRDSYVLRRIKEHYAGSRPELTIAEVVRSDVLRKFIDESKHAVAA